VSSLPFQFHLTHLTILVFCLANTAQAQTLSGRVKDAIGAGIEGAQVLHTPSATTVTSGVDGTWTLTPASLQEKTYSSGRLQFQNERLMFSIADPNQHVEIGLYNTEGRKLKSLINETLNPGDYQINPQLHALSPGMYWVKASIGTSKFSLTLQTPGQPQKGESSLARKGNSGISTGSGAVKVGAAGDSLIASKAGYLPATVVLTEGKISGIDFTLSLDPSFTAYKLPPPNGCMNQFFAKGCITGDANSTCGGECRVANSCSPPEDPSKGDLPKNFICPRFMMFSTAMMQAARDDAQQYGWGDGSASSLPFQYGVVGHDADVGGLDDNSSSCCQCYQLVFETPEPSSPQFPELPQPKSMVVQSFNTAASGPKGFDIFMGAGGYGAFNSCYDDPAFGNTTNFDEFLYQGYPFQNPGSGGISFLRYPVCTGTAWPPTAAGLKSAQCQETLEQQCNQAQSVSAQVTADTRHSCKQTNQLESLYHQNWKVRAKRVQCPENLTRVTGCRLQEEHLPLPLPAVQTPAQAGANGTFTGPDEQYHTTTMQDCCMPTCAWSDWVGGKSLKPVDGWSSFYSCDKTGTPRTE
jgi:hypothetical protein